MKTKKKTSKKSIREFVSENELKFQLYLLKYSNQLKNIKEKTEQEIIEQFNDERTKRLNLIERDKRLFEGNDLAQEALDLNEQYVNSWEPPIDENKVHEQFNKRKEEFIVYLEDKIKKENKKKDIDMLNYVNSIVLTEKASKEKFGQMLLLIIKNMATMPSFGGYTENWKTDFYSNAIEKTLLYVHNFDEDLVSKRSGTKSKAFAYVTQICYNAFVNVINIRKAESSFIKDSISYNSRNVDGVRNTQLIRETLEHEEDYSLNELIFIIDEDDDIVEIINEKVKKVQTSNETHKNNKEIIQEINYLEETTQDKDEHYYNYVAELEQNIKETEYPRTTSIIFQKPKGKILPKDFEMPEFDYDISIRGPIEKKSKEDISDEVSKEDQMLSDYEEFNKEWSI